MAKIAKEKEEKQVKESKTSKATKTKKTTETAPIETTPVETKPKKKHFKRYVSYNERLARNIIIFVLALSLCLYLAPKSFEIEDARIVKFRENNTIDYRVRLKENEFYETEYLDKGMIYVASLIDKIELTFNYDFGIDTKVDLDFHYKILGDLVISSVNGETNFLKKTYTLLDSETEQIIDKDTYTLDKELEIDYDYYNQLANNFRSQYGVDTNSYLNVYLQVDKTGGNEQEEIDLEDSITSTITIPLSEKAIEINFDSKDTHIDKNITTDRELIFNRKPFAVECVLFIIAVIFLVRIIKLLLKLRNKKKVYDTLLDKILREYDRLIVETSTGVDMNKNHIIRIDKFQELLDVRDNLKLPIMYYNVTNHHKCYFYIKDNDDVYVCYLKAVDVENQVTNKNV